MADDAQPAETWEDVPADAPPADQTPAPAPVPKQAAPRATQPAPPGEGRQITVQPRAAPKPPPKPIEPHEAVPLSVQPDVAAPAAQGQKPPPPSKETWEDVPAQWGGWGPEIGKSVQGGLAEGTEGLLGTPRDLPNLVDYGLDWAAAHLAHPGDSEGAQRSIQDTHGSLFRMAIGDKAYNALSAFNPLPTGAYLQSKALQSGLDPGYKPQSVLGRYAHEIAAFAPGALVPGLGEAGMAARLAGTGKRLVGTIAPAVTSETLGHATEGTQFEPAARFAGSILGGATQSSAGALVKPLTKSGQTEMAATELRDAATDPAAALANIRAAQAQTAPGRATGEIVPGSKPTTSQLANDSGLVGAEREYQTQNAVQHSQLENKQQAAQSTALQDVQQGGDATKVADLITQRLQQIDQNHEAQVEMAKQLHETGLQAHEQGVAQAEAAARGATGQVARQGAPEVLGEKARGVIAQSMAARRAEEKRLWDAIGADKIGVRPHQIGGQARKLQRQVGPMQKPMEGDEARIFNNASRLGKDVTRLSDVTDLTSDLKTAMRKERMTNGKTPALARMTQLLKTAENVIKNAATRASAKEAEEGMGRLRAMTKQDRANIMAARAASRARGDIERGPAGAITRQGATADSYRTMESQVPGKIFAKGPTGYQKAKAYKDATGKPWLDPFTDIVSDSMAREATTNGMIDPAKLAKWQKDYEGALRALPADVAQNYVKGPAEAAAQLAEDAANRRDALIAHQKVDIAKQMGKSPADDLRKDPAFKGFEGQTSPRDVQHLVGGLFSRKDAVHQMTRLRGFLTSQPGGASAAEGLKRAALDHMLERVTSQRQAGIASGVKALAPGTTQKLIASYKPIMAAAGFSPAQLRAMDQVADDIERQQTLYSTTIQKGSPTGQNLSKVLKKIAEKGGHSTAGLLSLYFAAKEAYEYIPEALHGPAGLTAVGAALAARHAYNKAKNAGLKNAQDIYHDAIENPDKAADLLSRPNPKSHARLAEKYGRQAMYAGLAGERSMTLKHAQ